jgi:GNAT superfamily N-acetyltransferase
VGVTIEPFLDPGELPESDVAGLAAAMSALWADLVAGERPWSIDAFVWGSRLRHHPQVHRRFLARDDDGAVAGWSEVEWRATEPGLAQLRLAVVPAQRRRGIATALASPAIDEARAAGRTSVLLEAPVDTPVDAACRAAGLTPDLTVEVNDAPAGAAPTELLEGWIAAGEAAGGYSLVTYDDVCPDHLAEGFTRVRHVMNDAPAYEGEAPQRFDVSELRAVEASFVDAHTAWWEAGVRHDATDEIVGLSDLFLPEGRPWIGMQGDTGVRADHRGHGLGAWMKAANHLRARRERPGLEHYRTYNASENAPMLRINRALGYRPSVTLRGWSLPLR